MIYFILSFFIVLNILSMILMLNFKVSETAIAEVPFFIKSYSYRDDDYDIQVSKEREKDFTIRHYKFDVKIIEKYQNNTTKVKLLNSYVDNSKVTPYKGTITVIDNSLITYKI
jgi:hypothetical protein